MTCNVPERSSANSSTRAVQAGDVACRGCGSGAAMTSTVRSVRAGASPTVPDEDCRGGGDRVLDEHHHQKVHEGHGPGLRRFERVRFPLDVPRHDRSRSSSVGGEQRLRQVADDCRRVVEVQQFGPDGVAGALDSTPWVSMIHPAGVSIGDPQLPSGTRSHGSVGRGRETGSSQTVRSWEVTMAFDRDPTGRQRRSGRRAASVTRCRRPHRRRSDASARREAASPTAVIPTASQASAPFAVEHGH